MSKFLTDKDVHKLQQQGDVVTIEGRLFVALEAVEAHAAPPVAEEKPAAATAKDDGKK